MSVHVIEKAIAVESALHPNVYRATRQGSGRLIYCARCLGKVHCAWWVTGPELEARLAAFTVIHKGCR